MSTSNGRDESRGRAPSRRAASVVPGRDSSQGRSYPHNSLFPNGLGNPPPVHPTSGLSQSPHVLSRISSNESLESSVPPVQPGEAAPAYESISSAPPSPLHLPQTIEEVPTPTTSEDLNLSPPVTRSNPSASSSYQRLRSPTPSRSPLGLSPSFLPTSSNGMPRLARSSTRASQDSSNSTNSSHTTPSIDVHGGDQSSSSIISSSSASENDRGRTLGARNESDEPGDLTVVQNNIARRSRSSLRSSSRASPSPSRTVSLNASTGPRLPSALKSKGATNRSGSHARFSLGGITDALRGKSSSRTRAPIVDDQQRSTSISRRDPSPDVSRSLSNGRPASIKGGGGGRSQSRGRKTALKVLREALTTGHAHLHETESHDGNFDDDHDLPSENTGDGWKEFKAGTYVYPISIPVPGTLPPSLNCEFGSVSYHLKATVVRAGALTTNLTANSEVILVAMPGDDDTEESESIVVERFWETQMKYHVALSGKVSLSRSLHSPHGSVTTDLLPCRAFRSVVKSLSRFD